MTTKLIIDRQRWLRGEGGGSSALLRKADQKMCCLGFYCIQNGMPPETILNVGMPSELTVETIESNTFLLPLVAVSEDECGMVFANDRSTCDALAGVNDDTTIGADERETKITELFEEIDVEVEFVN